MAKRLTIKEAERRHLDMVKGQRWHGCEARYKYTCEKHGVYLQRFQNHNNGGRCKICGRARVDLAKRTAEGLSITPEYQTVVRHFEMIFNSKNPRNKYYKGMPFFDEWNLTKGGTYVAAAKWIVGNIGKRPEGASLHIVEHEKGFMPGNLEWAHPRKQMAQQMFKIIADLKHRIKELELENANLKSNS